MALTLVGSATNVVGTAPITVTIPNGAVAGNLLVLIVGSHDSVITPSIAFTTFQAPAMGFGAYSFVMYRVMDGTEGTSFTIGNANSSYCDAVCFAVSGQAASTPLSSWSIGTGTYSATATVPASTTTLANSLWIQIGAMASGGIGTLSGGNPVGSTIIAELTDNANAGVLGVYSAAVASVGTTGTATVTFPGANTSLGAGFIISPASASAPAQTEYDSAIQALLFDEPYEEWAEWQHDASGVGANNVDNLLQAERDAVYQFTFFDEPYEEWAEWQHDASGVGANNVNNLLQAERDAVYQFTFFDEPYEEWAEWQYESASIGQNALAAVLRPPEDGWIDDDLADDEWLPDDYQQVSLAVAAAQSQEDVWDWDECSDDEWYADDYQQVTAQVATPQSPDDTWDWDDFVDDEWRSDDYQPMVAAIASSQQSEDAFDWFDDVEDDWQAWSEFDSGASEVNALALPQIFDDGWLEDDVDDDWSVDQSLSDLTISVASGTPDDVWDWDEFGDDEWLVEPGLPANASVIPAIPDDAWDWHEDVDDEWLSEFTPIAAVVIPAATCPDEQLWFDDLAEDDWLDDSYPVSGPVQAKPIDDAWDWSEDVDDEWDWGYAGLQPMAFVPLCIDDIWPWDDELDDDAQMLCQEAGFMTASAPQPGDAWLVDARLSVALVRARADWVLIDARPSVVLLRRR